CWTLALLAFIRAREEGGRWWIAVGVAAGLGLLSKYAMAYWLISALLYLVAVKDERRHLKPFLGASAIALAVYAPNFVWNAVHGFVSYHHTEDNAAFHGLAFHSGHFLEFLGSQFGVFGPLLFGALLLIAARPLRLASDWRARFLAFFALPTLAMMLVVSILSRAEPNWAAPTYVAATVLVVAWLLQRGWRWVAIASVALHVTAAVAILGAPAVAQAMGRELPAEYNLLHRLHGYRALGLAVSQMMRATPDAVLCGNDRETMAELLYYVQPRPTAFLKWNGGDNRVHDGFDLEAHPERFVGRDFLLVSASKDVAPIVARFVSAGPVTHIIIPIGSGREREYVVRYLKGLTGY
ncbi:MAG: glycosyltransferase family 39 protein, partial [Stellaceae bacterium]